MFLALRDDIREALRRVRRNPRLTLVAVGTLALGIGAATAVLTMAHTVLYAPPPYRHPDRLVALAGYRAGRPTGLSIADLQDCRSTGVFEAAGVMTYGEYAWTGQSLPGFDGAEVLRGRAVSNEYFRVFDQPMALGRGFARDEGAAGHEAVVISHSLWQRRFGGRPDVLGQTLTLDGRVHTIVGVTGPGFVSYDSFEVLVWVAFTPKIRERDNRGWGTYARLAPEITRAEAQRRIDAVEKRLATEAAATNKDYRVAVTPLLDSLQKRARPAFLALVAAVGCLLLIAAANVASLLLAKATSDAREMAIRAALGAGRGRLFRMMLVQSLALALISALAGGLAGMWLLDGARTLMPPSLAFGWMFVIDRRLFVVAFLVSAVAGLFAGLAPGFESFRLAAGGLRPFSHRSRLLRGIVTAEIALAIFLSVGAGLLVKSFVAMSGRSLGYETQNVLGMRVYLTGDRYKTTEQIGDYWVRLTERIAALPGVAKAAAVSDLPMGWKYIGGDFQVEGHVASSGEERANAHWIAASPGYFATVGIPILQGRGFTDADGPNAEPVAIVNDRLAEKWFPGQSAIGRRIMALGDNQWRRIVGVTRRIRHGGPQDQYGNELYMPYRQFNEETMFLVVRGYASPESLVPSIRESMKALDPNVPPFEIRTLEQAFARETAQPRLPMVLTTAFATIALLLAGLGLFGVIAYWVSQRTRELGVRAALGARPGELRSLVLRQGSRLLAIGLVLGIGTSLAAMRLLRSLLFGMSERDPSVYVTAILVAVATTIVACWLPAMRASRIDPSAALREE